MSAALDLLLPLAAPTREPVDDPGGPSKGPPDASFAELLDHSVREESAPHGDLRPLGSEAEEDRDLAVAGDPSLANAMKAAAPPDPVRDEAAAQGESRPGSLRAPSALSTLEGSEQAATRLAPEPIAPLIAAAPTEPVAAREQTSTRSGPAAGFRELHDVEAERASSTVREEGAEPRLTRADLPIPVSAGPHRAASDRTAGGSVAAHRAQAAAHVDDLAPVAHESASSADAVPPPAPAAISGAALESAPAPVAPNAGAEIHAAPARGTASGPAPAEPVPSAPVEDVAVRVEWLAQRGGGVARLELDPPQLGRIEMIVRLRGSDVEVVIAASEPLAQAAVQSQRAQLAENLAARDLRLSQFDVSHSGGEDASGSESSEGRPSSGGDGTHDHRARSALERFGVREAAGPLLGLAPASRASPTDARIDLHV